METNDFLDHLDRHSMVPNSIVQKLREKVAAGDRRITAKSVLKYLVKKEMVTRSQAKELLSTTLEVSPAAESSILGSASSSFIVAKPVVVPPEPEEEILTIEPVDDELLPDTAENIWEVEAPPLAAEPPAGDSFLGKQATADPFLDEIKQPKQRSQQIDRAAEKLRKRRREKKNEWDSPLLLYGGGGLLLLLLVGAVVYYLLYRENADKILAEANQNFDSGSYTQSIKGYQRFVDNFPNHPEFSFVRVRLAVAEIWKATSGGGDFSAALKTTKQALDQIENQPQLDQAHGDLASRLPVIAEGLANQADASTDPKEIERLLNEAAQALSLNYNTKFVPASFRDPTRLAAIQETLDRVHRRLEEQAHLAGALVKIDEALQSGDVAAAYAVHRQLVVESPALLGDAQLQAKLAEVSATEAGLIRFIEQPQPAETDEPPTPLVATLTLAARDGDGGDATGNVAVRVGSAAYLLEAKSGTLLWRRYVGTAPGSTPVRVGQGDFLLVDAVRNELVRVDGATGNARWRLGFEGPIVDPVPLDDRLLVAEVSGKLHVVEAENGLRLGYVEFSQAIHVPPAVDPKGKCVYVVGEQSSLYSLRADDFSCLGVYYLGHEKGAVAVASLAVLDKLLVAENTGHSTSELHALEVTDDGRADSLVESHRLDGLITTPLLVEGRRVAALTDAGAVLLVELGSGTGPGAVTQIAARPGSAREPIAEFGYLDSGHVWTADSQLAKLAIQPTDNRLQVRNLEQDFSGDVFDAPLERMGDALISVRRPRGGAGFRVSAVAVGTGQELWQTELAVPLAAAPVVDARGSRITALTASGSAYSLDRQTMARRIADSAERLSGAAGRRLSPLSTGVDLDEGRIAAGAVGSKSLVHFRPDDLRSGLHPIALPAPLAAPLVRWQDGFVAASEVGQVYLYDAADGQPLADAFQPTLSPGTEYHWLEPAIFGAGEDSRLVLSDGVESIYLVERLNDPQPHLAAQQVASLGSTILTTRLAVAGDRAFAGTDGGSMVSFQLPDLAAQPPVDVGAPLVWGPYAVGDRITCITANDELLCLDASASVLWKQPLQHGPAAGAPLADADSMLLAWQAGGVSRIGLAGGDERAHVDLDQTLFAGPVSFGSRLLLGAADGTVLVVNRPE